MKKIEVAPRIVCPIGMCWKENINFCQRYVSVIAIVVLSF